MKTTTPAARCFAESGWHRNPVPLNKAGLGPISFRVYAFISAWADDGLPDVPDAQEAADACKITLDDWERGLKALEGRKMLIRHTLTDWTLTDSKTWD